MKTKFYLYFGFAVLFGPSTLSNSVIACEIAHSPSGFSGALSSGKYFSVDSRQPYTVKGTETHLGWSNETWQFSHDYLALGFPVTNPTTPITNGDLHRLNATYRNTSNYEDFDISWSIGPTLAVSSNQLKNPENLQSSSFRIDGSFTINHQWTHNWSYSIGVCTDALSGKNEVLPILSVNRSIGDRWRFAIGYPKTSVNYLLLPSIELFANWELSGNEWEVLDKALKNRSDVNWRSQTWSLGAHWKTASAFNISLQWKLQTEQEVSYLTRRNQHISVVAENTDIWEMMFVFNW